MKQASLFTRFRESQLFWPLVALGLILLFDAIFAPNFFKIGVLDGHLYGNLIDVLNDGAPLALVAIGMTMVIATGGVDLSVGAVIAGSVMSLKREIRHQGPVLLVSVAAYGLATVFFGAAIGPLIAAGILQTVYVTPFSLPTLIGFSHVFFTAILETWQSPSRYSMASEREFVGMSVMGVGALLAYAFITWLTYRSTVDRFDEFSGRIRPKFGPPVDRSEEPVATLQASDVV